MSMKQKVLLIITIAAIGFVCYLIFPLHNKPINATFYQFSDITFDGNILKFRYNPGAESGTTVKDVSTRYAGDTLYIKLVGGLMVDSDLPYKFEARHVEVKVKDPTIKRIYIESRFGFKKILLFEKK